MAKFTAMRGPKLGPQGPRAPRMPRVPHAPSSVGHPANQMLGPKRLQHVKFGGPPAGPPRPRVPRAPKVRQPR